MIHDTIGAPPYQDCPQETKNENMVNNLHPTLLGAGVRPEPAKIIALHIVVEIS